MRYLTNRLAGIGLCAAALAGCASGGVTPSSGTGSVAVNHSRFTAAFDYLRVADYDAAETELNKLARRTPDDPQVLINLGIVYARSGRLDDAGAVLTRAIALRPNAAVAHNELGIVNRLNGRFAESEKAYRAALDIDPAYAIAHYNLGVLLDIYMRQPEQALNHYQQYLVHAVEGDSKVRLWVKDLQRRTGQQPSTAATTPGTDRL